MTLLSQMRRQTFDLLMQPSCLLASGDIWPHDHHFYDLLCNAPYGHLLEGHQSANRAICPTTRVGSLSL